MNAMDLLTRIRQHHALEHATLHVLSRRNPYVRLMGRSTISGFWIYAPLNTQEVASAASEALARLQQGEAYLAVHPNCGTNLSVTSVLAGTAAFGATLGRPRSKLERLPLALLAATAATLAAQPHITTSPDVEDLYIAQVERHERGKIVLHRIVVAQD
jgi:hypothetical protein